MAPQRHLVLQKQFYFETYFTTIFIRSALSMKQGKMRFPLEAVHCRPKVRSALYSNDLEMQVLDCTQYIRPPSPGISVVSHIEVPVIRLYGCTMSGHSVLLHVYNFEPYLWIEAPPQWNASQHMEYFRQSLNTMLAPQTRSPGTIVRIEEHERDSLLYHSVSENSKKSFLKLVCQLPGQIPKVRTAVEGALTLPRLWNGQRNFLTYESNVLFPLRFLVDLDIGGSSWVRIPKGKFRETQPRVSNCQVELDVSQSVIESFEATGEWMKIAPFRILSLDIECQGRKGYFPEASRDPVIQIAVHGTTAHGTGHRSSEETAEENESFDDEQVACNKVFTLGSCASIASCHVHSYENEKDMLIAFSDFLSTYDPDFLTGYNISNFDFPYLMERATTLQIASRFSTWGRILDERTSVRDKSFSSKQQGNRVYKELICDGRIVLDVMLCVQRDYKLRSYSLNSVSQSFLGEQKEDVHHSIISDLQNGNEETRRRLAVYCLKDAVLPVRLIEKLMLLINNIEMARVSGVPIGWLLERGQQIKVFSQMLRKAQKKQLLFPAVERYTPSEEGVGFEGATVIEPKRGYYEEPIATLDFASLYPSIMMAYNLCYSTLVRPSEVGKLPSDSYTTTPSGHVFVKPERFRGILPQILEEFLTARKAAKAAMKHATTPLEHAVLNGRQLALKISANSVYGFTGAQVGKLPCLEISSSVTSYGRTMIEKTKELVEQHYSTAEGYEKDAQVIYGDTDSVMVNFRASDSSASDCVKLEKSMKLGKEAASLVTSNFPSPIKLEFEKVYFPYMLMNKKRYAGLLWTQPDKYDKLDVKGIEAVRRDNCPLVANIVSTVLNRILIERSIPRAVDFVKKTISDMLMNRLDISHLVISKTFSKAEDEYVAKQAHIALVERMRKRDPATAPVVGDRVAYVIVKGPKGAKAYEKSEDPLYVLEHNIAIDANHYLEHQLALPLQRLFEGIIDKPESLVNGDHTRHISVSTPSKAAGGIMKFAKVNLQCLACRTAMKPGEKGAVCKACEPIASEVYLRILEKRNHYETMFGRVWTQCQRCQGSLHQEVLCTSRDCPVFYMRKKVQSVLKEEQSFLDRFGHVEW